MIGAPADLIDRAALLRLLRDDRDDYVNEHFVMDPETGIHEAGEAQEEYLGYLDERIELIETFAAVASPAVNAVACERRKQVLKGYDAAHDDEHDNGELAFAASALAMDSDGLWPWGRTGFPAGTRREQLVKAAAMLVADIERIDRAEQLSTCQRPEGDR